MDKPKPRPGRTTTALSRGIYTRVHPDLHRDLRVRAAEEDRTMSEVIVSAIKLYLQRPAGAAPKVK